MFRLVALPAPTAGRRHSFTRNVTASNFQLGGEIVILDRSWYNRAGVEHVMGSCTEDEYKTFLKNTPAFENFLVNSGMARDPDLPLGPLASMD